MSKTKSIDRTGVSPGNLPSPELDSDFKIELVGTGTTQHEVEATRRWLAMHVERFRGTNLPKITCTCRCRVRIDKSYRCRMCGVWFCSECADRHFNLRMDSLGRVRRVGVMRRWWSAVRRLAHDASCLLSAEDVKALQQENEWLKLKAKGRRLECEELRQYAGELIDPDGNHDILCCAIVYFKKLKEGG